MTDPPLILVTNDDGLIAPGLQAVCAELSELGRVVAVAPHRQRSAVSHSITLHKPLRLDEVETDRYMCSGTPADCVYIAFHHVLDRLPDLVVSGINQGPNLGDDVIYSGTTAGAREAMLMGVQSIACSLERGSRFNAGARIIGRIAGRVLDRGLPDGIFLNVNLPREVEDASPWRLTTLGERHYGREVSALRDPRGRPYYWIGGADLGTGNVPGSDGNAIADGQVSITPVHAHNTCKESLEQLASWPWGHEDP
jgi:5'-nucleotidase